MRIHGKPYRAVWWDDVSATVQWIEQRLLPHRLEIKASSDPEEVARAIEIMEVRGAPTIGATAAYGLALAYMHSQDRFESHWLPRFRATRPTAVNLFHACDAMQEAASNASAQDMCDVAKEYAENEVERNRKMGEIMAGLLAVGERRIQTHCNAGWLAAVDWGTATAGIYRLAAHGESPTVWVDETRPRLQGARLTAWELMQEGIECRLQADGAAAWKMARGEVDAVVVGADRIAANGDVANKIGTYGLSLAAKAHGVPFYVVAPSSTFDAACDNGGAIPIEEREASEVTHMDGVDENGDTHLVRIAAEGVAVSNPAFDVTPYANITAIVNEHGIWQP